MNATNLSAVLLALVAGLPAAGAAQSPQPTPAGSEMHVTVPSLPGQPNKSGTVRPDGGMPMDSEGYAVTKRYDPTGAPASGAPPPGGGAPAASGSAAPHAAGYVPPIGPAPSGKAVATGANYVTIRGTVKEVKDKAVVVKVKKTGATLTYTLAANATVSPGLKAGDSVKVRVLAAQKGRVADRVERLPPPQ